MHAHVHTTHPWLRAHKWAGKLELEMQRLAEARNSRATVEGSLETLCERVEMYLAETSQREVARARVEAAAAAAAVAAAAEEERKRKLNLRVSPDAFDTQSRSTR